MKTNWSPNHAVMSMLSEKDGKNIVHEFFIEMSKQLIDKKKIKSGAAVGVLIKDEDLIVLKVAGTNKLYIVTDADPDTEEFEFAESLDEDDNKLYHRELANQLSVLDGVRPGTVQGFKEIKNG